MQKMFVANLTSQIQVFAFRLPESNKAFHQDIPIGGQIPVAGRNGRPELDTKDIEAIVRQHAKYGLIDVAEIDRTKAFTGMCFSLDKPVNVSKIRYAIEHNHLVLVERGKEIREAAAVGISQKIENENPGLKGLEMTAIEVDDKKTGRTGEFSEALRVDKTQPPSERPGKAKNQRRRKCAEAFVGFLECAAR